MSYIDCRYFNERPPSTDAPITANDSNPHHGSPVTNDNSEVQSNLQSFSTGPQNLAIYRKIQWPPRTTLNVVFISSWKNRDNGEIISEGSCVLSKKLTDAVAEYSKLWEPHCNIRFTFEPAGKPDIRVAFAAEEGSWSHLGTMNRDIPEDERTMNLGFTAITDVAVLKGTTLHEFGHVLGCVHEHQSPNSPIKWNKAAVIAAVAKPPNKWNAAKAKFNILDMHQNTDDSFLVSSFDPDSIMLYPFDASWMLNPECTADSAGTHDNYDLSRFDKRIIGEMYPTIALATGRFATPSIQSGTPRLLQHPRNILVAKPDRHSPAPNIAVGLSSLHVKADSNVRIRTSVDNIKQASYDLHIDTWANTKFNYAACNWLETPHSSYFQVGSWNTMERRAWNVRNPPATTTADIKFKRAFDEIPTIVVWLNWIDTNRGHDTCIKAYVTDPSPDGFKIHIETWGDCILYSGGASWIAYPPKAASGIISEVVRTTKDTGNAPYEKTGQITFPEDLFTWQPKALIAVTSIDFAHGKDVHFDVLVEMVERTGMWWRIDSSSHSGCRGIDATYIAY